MVKLYCYVENCFCLDNKDEGFFSLKGLENIISIENLSNVTSHCLIWVCAKS